MVVKAVCRALGVSQEPEGASLERFLFWRDRVASALGVDDVRGGAASSLSPSQAYEPVLLRGSFARAKKISRLNKAKQDARCQILPKSEIHYPYRIFESGGVQESPVTQTIPELTAYKFFMARVTGKSGVIPSAGKYAGGGFGSNQRPPVGDERKVKLEYNLDVLKGEGGLRTFRMAAVRPWVFVPGKSLLLTFFRDEAFSHFIFEVLPILAVAQGRFDAVNFIVGPQLKPYQEEMLVACGVPRQQILRKTHDHDFICEELFVVNAPGKNNVWITKPALSFIRKAFLSHARVERKKRRTSLPEGVTRFYVDRNDDRAEMRRIVNEPELKRVAEMYGFKVVTPGLMSLGEKTDMFKRATHIIGQYGGGLQFGMATCARDVSMLVIQSPHFIRRQMAYMRALYPVNVLHVHGSEVEGLERVNLTSPFHVDPALFEGALRAMLKGE